MMIEPEEVPEPMETTFTSDQTAGGEFLSLDELGKVLRQLALQGVIQHSPLENVHLSLIFVIIKMARRFLKRVLFLILSYENNFSFTCK